MGTGGGRGGGGGLGLIGWDSGGGDEEVVMVTSPFLLKVMM